MLNIQGKTHEIILGQNPNLNTQEARYLENLRSKMDLKAWMKQCDLTYLYANKNCKYC